ncbi:MAG: periplasmic heavy metal sensor [Acidobacteriota bacterium]
MKKRITLIAVVLAVAALATAPIVHARPGSPGRQGMSRRAPGFGLLGHLRHVRQQLDLTDQQAEQIRTIAADLRAQNAQYRDQLRGGRKGVADVLLANPADVAAAQAVLDQRAATERLVKQNRLNATAKALGVLSADQRARLRTLIAERAERRERRERP